MLVQISQDKGATDCLSHCKTDIDSSYLLPVLSFFIFQPHHPQDPSIHPGFLLVLALLKAHNIIIDIDKSFPECLGAVSLCVEALR